MAMLMCEKSVHLLHHLDGLGGKIIGLVPTMGNLHDGHLALVRAALKCCDHVVTTIFVNPIQFGAHEDFHEYPRTLEEDLAVLWESGCHTVYAPSVDDLFPSGELSITKVCVPRLTETLCGKDRPGHFDGVTTIICKLFNLVHPQFAFFGEKDWQQLTIINKMVVDLGFDFLIDIQQIPTQRESDGLAMSSRNSRLNANERQRAPVLYQCLCEIRDKIAAGSSDYRALEQQALRHLSDNNFQPSYVSVRDEDTLIELNPRDLGKFRVFGAACLGNTRLIDNVGIEL